MKKKKKSTVNRLGKPFMSTFKTFRLWHRNIAERLSDDTGWELFFKIVAIGAAIIGLLYTNLTFQTERCEQELRRANNSYYNYTSNFGSHNPNARLGAIIQVPQMLLMKAPEKTNFGVFESVLITMGIINYNKPIYNNFVKKYLYEYVKSQTKKNKNWTKDEMEAIISTLIKIGYNGWYNSSSKGEKINKRDGLNWIWMENTKGTDESVPIHNIFEDLKLDGLNFSNYNFLNSDFNLASFVDCDFTNSYFYNVNMQSTDLTDAIFDNVKIKNINFSGAKFNSTSFNYALINGDNNLFTKANLINMRITNSIFKRTYFDLETIMDSLNFFNDSIINSFFRGATIKNSYIFRSALVNVNFHDADIKNCTFDDNDLNSIDFSSTKFKNVKFVNCVQIKNVDFSNAYLENVEFEPKSFKRKILEDPTVKWKNARIKYIIKLSSRDKRILKSRGAIIEN